jgi:polysaccharide export outer membrane protein
MGANMIAIRTLKVVGLLSLLLPMAANSQPIAPAPVATPAGAAVPAPDYVIGPGDVLQVFVWKKPDLSTEVPVRPDGKITTPLVPDVQAEGKTSTELAAELRTKLSAYVEDPVVTVMVKTFAAPDNEAAIRVIGAATTPKTVPYRVGITALDVIIAVGGLNTYASGNSAQLIRRENGAYHTYPLHLADLLSGGDMSDNVQLMPGDIIRIPERWF